MTQTRSVITSWKSPVTHKIVSLQQGILTPTKSDITPLWLLFLELSDCRMKTISHSSFTYLT